MLSLLRAVGGWWRGGPGDPRRGAIAPPRSAQARRGAVSSMPMSIRIVRLGTARHADEGLRIGTVRRPPRGVPKSEFARQNWYDVWFPNLAPSLDTMRQAQAASDDREWQAFTRKYRAEMAAPERQHDLALLAELSRRTNFSVGCYCENEARCHRSLLRALLVQAGADVV